MCRQASSSGMMFLGKPSCIRHKQVEIFRLIPASSGKAKVIFVSKCSNITIILVTSYLRKLTKLPGLSEIKSVLTCVLTRLGKLVSEGEFGSQQPVFPDQDANTSLEQVEKCYLLCDFCIEKIRHSTPNLGIYQFWLVFCFVCFGIWVLL